MGVNFDCRPFGGIYGIYLLSLFRSSLLKGKLSSLCRSCLLKFTHTLPINQFAHPSTFEAPYSEPPVVAAKHRAFLFHGARKMGSLYIPVHRPFSENDVKVMLLGIRNLFHSFQTGEKSKVKAMLQAGQRGNTRTPVWEMTAAYTSRAKATAG